MSIVNDIFRQVDFDGEDRQYHYDLFNKFKALALDIDKHAPESAEKTLVFRALHLAFMHAGTAMAKNHKYNI